MHAPRAAPAVPRTRDRRSSAAGPDPAAPISMSVSRVPPRPRVPARLVAALVFVPARQVGHQIDAEQAAARQDAVDRVERGAADPARASATGGCRRAPSPARNRSGGGTEAWRISPRTSDAVPVSRLRAQALAAAGEHRRPSGRCRPTGRRRARPEPMIRPVPHPSSRTRPSCAAASRSQNGTSRRATVCAFSQS